VLAFEDPERFEHLLSGLSATFVSLPSDQIDGTIQESLRGIVESLGIERSSLALLSEDRQRLEVTHSYGTAGLPPLPKGDLGALLPWYTEMVRKGEVLRFNRIPEDLPPEAVAERAFWLRVGLRSQLTVPFRVGDSVFGVIGFASYRAELDWSPHLVQCLRLVGEVFANALARKQAEQESARLREQLAHISRLTAMGEVTASIAHEVNQPLCAIVSNAQAAARLLGRSTIDVAEIGGALDDIIDDANRASAIISRVRGFLQRSPTQHVPLDVNAVIHQVLGLIKAEMARRKIRVATNLAEPLPPVVADPVQLQQVLVNLLINGAEAMDDIEPDLRKLEVRSSTDGQATAIAVDVRDWGRGLDPRAQAHLFGPFFTTKPGGLGMGLAICKSIIESHGGHISPRTSPGPGTTMQFTLPVARRATNVS
jgi:signal transduction histidine kinase